MEYRRHIYPGLRPAVHALLMQRIIDSARGCEDPDDQDGLRPATAIRLFSPNMAQHDPIKPIGGFRADTVRDIRIPLPPVLSDASVWMAGVFIPTLFSDRRAVMNTCY
jgi:hypothetical protein